jgi:Flp pilus assembly protein TadG
MLFGLSALPLVGLAGAAVDYSRAANYQSRMQLAVDATALAIVREPTTLNAREIQQKGEQYLASALRTDVSATLTSVTVTREGRSVKVAAAATMDRTILKVMGRDPMPIGATSQASSARKLEVALVLDNTYSMSERLDDGTEKMIALKKQAKKVLDSLQTLDAQPGRGRDSVKVSIVPFDTEVRLDTAKFRNENWFEWLNGANASNWTGYVYDRPGNYAASDGLPTGARDSYFPAPRESECSSGGAMNCPSSADLPVIQPLTSIANSRSRLDAVIRDMQPRGFTISPSELCGGRRRCRAPSRSARVRKPATIASRRSCSC